MILFLTDLHFGMKKFSEKMYNLQIDYFKDKIFPYILENDIKQVIHCGDIVDNEMEIDNRLLLDLKTDFINWFESHKVNLYLLHGNHDSYYKNNTDYSFTKVLSNNMNYIHSIVDIETLKIGANRFTFVPHSKEFSHITDLGDVIIAHHDIADVVFNVHQKSKKGLSIDELEKLKVPILIGHYHNQSVTKNCRYLGTLFQYNWGEFGFRKGFWVLDDVHKTDVFKINEQLKFIEQTELPRFIRVEYIQEGRKQPSFIISDGISPDRVETDYNVIKDLVSKNHIELKAENYNIETKYMEMINDLNSICYSEITINNSKRLNKAIEQMLEMNEETDCDISNDSGILELCKHFFSLLPDTLDNKEEMKNLFMDKVETIGG